jgi:phosphate uptake regulator
MIEDCEAHMKSESNNIELLKQKDADVSRLQYFITRVINSVIKNKTMTEIKTQEILYYTELSNSLEKIANQIKRIPRYTNKRMHPEIIKVYEEIITNYKEAMKANYTKNIPLIIETMNKRKSLFERCDKLEKLQPKPSSILIEKMKNTVNNVSQLSRSYLKYIY